MSSTGPTPQPAAEVLTRYADVMRQQRQELIKKLTLAQQVARPAAMATPSPGMTTEALRAKVNDRLATMTATVQQTYQSLEEALAQGDAKATLELERTGLNSMIKQFEQAQEDLRNARQQAQAEFQRFDQQSTALFNILSQTLKTMSEMRGAVIKNML